MKKKKFVVHISEILGRNIIIEAHDDYEAKEIAEFLCNDGTINLDCEDFGDRKIETVREASSEDENIIKEFYRV